MAGAHCFPVNYAACMYLNIARFGLMRNGHRDGPKLQSIPLQRKQKTAAVIKGGAGFAAGGGAVGRLANGTPRPICRGCTNLG